MAQRTPSARKTTTPRVPEVRGPVMVPICGDVAEGSEGRCASRRRGDETPKKNSKMWTIARLSLSNNSSGNQIKRQRHTMRHGVNNTKKSPMSDCRKDTPSAAHGDTRTGLPRARWPQRDKALWKVGNNKSKRKEMEDLKCHEIPNKMLSKSMSEMNARNASRRPATKLHRAAMGPTAATHNAKCVSSK